MRWALNVICSLVLLNAVNAFAFNVNDNLTDLSPVDAFPTELTLELGSNILLGSAGQVGNAADFDIFRFNVPQNLVVSALLLNDYAPSSGVSFIGIQSGTTWTAGKGNVDGSQLIGWALFGANNIGEDLLPTASTAGQGASGFDLPLGPGDYVFLIQDTGSSVSYDFDFVASPVPIPAAFGLLLPCLALLIKGRKPVVIA